MFASYKVENKLIPTSVWGLWGVGSFRILCSKKTQEFKVDKVYDRAYLTGDIYWYIITKKNSLPSNHKKIAKLKLNIRTR